MTIKSDSWQWELLRPRLKRTICRIILLQSSVQCLMVLPSSAACRLTSAESLAGVLIIDNYIIHFCRVQCFIKALNCFSTRKRLPATRAMSPSLPPTVLLKAVGVMANIHCTSFDIQIHEGTLQSHQVHSAPLHMISCQLQAMSPQQSASPSSYSAVDALPSRMQSMVRTTVFAML